MKRLWLVGESLPLKEDGSQRKALKSSRLPETLVPLDPRHGVFPNLVTKPLFSGGYALSHTHPDQLLAFFREISAAVADVSVRRLNVFENRATRPKKRGPKRQPTREAAPEVFEIDSNKMRDRVNAFDVERDLWLVFGHQTNFGLLWWLIDSNAASKIEKDKIGEFSGSFVTAVLEASPAFAEHKPGSWSGRIGLLHRLCTETDDNQVLCQVVKKLNPLGEYSCERIVGLLRSTVPLLHNEGYQDGSNPTGNAQAHFVRNAVRHTANGDLYWQVMGNAVATRMLGRFVE